MPDYYRPTSAHTTSDSYIHTPTSLESRHYQCNSNEDSPDLHLMTHAVSKEETCLGSFYSN